MRRSLFAVSLVSFMLAGAAANANTPRLPPLTPESMNGNWEGLCVYADPWRDHTFAIRLAIAERSRGTATMGIWFGGSEPLLLDRLEIDRVIVSRGSVILSASRGTQGVWRKMHLQGRGFAFNLGGGWLRAHVSLPGTAYECDVTLFKQSPASGQSCLKEIAELIGHLEPTTEEKGRPTRR